MGLLLVRWTVGDIDPAAVGLPTCHLGIRKVVVSILDAPVVFLFHFVFHRAGSGVTPLPELFNEVLALRIGLQALEGPPLVIADDVSHILSEPLDVGSTLYSARWRFLCLGPCLLEGSNLLGPCRRCGRA